MTLYERENCVAFQFAKGRYSQQGAAELTFAHRLRGQVVYNCFSINQLVGQNIILMKRTETSAKIEKLIERTLTLNK